MQFYLGVKQSTYCKLTNNIFTNKIVIDYDTYDNTILLTAFYYTLIYIAYLWFYP